jgi:DNA cross-link repair 1A protein
VNADYQGLTKSFNHGKIYCSSVTARLVNMNMGIPYDKLHILPLNQKIEIAGISVTCLDANHCPGSIMILFEPPNGKVCMARIDFLMSLITVG